MPSARLFGSVLLTALALGTGCAVDSDSDDTESSEDALGASPKAAGIKDGSLEAEGVLLLANDRDVTEDVLRTRTKLSAKVARALVAGRTAADGTPKWYASIDEIDAIAGTDTKFFRQVLLDAKVNGYVEALGFDPPLYRVSIPDNLGRPPTFGDVTIEAGFDGKTPDEVVRIVRSRVTNPIHASNEQFVRETILDTHKSFTMAASNLFASGSPHAAFASTLAATRITLFGTASAVRRTYLAAEKGNTVTYYAIGASGKYEPVPRPSYPVLMRARIRLKPGGVRLFYPAWSAKALAGPTADVIEPK